MAFTLRMVDGRGVLFDEDGKERHAPGEAPTPAVEEQVKPEPKKAPAKKAASSKSDN